MVSDEMVSLELQRAQAFVGRVVQHVQTLTSDRSRKQAARIILEGYFNNCFRQDEPARPRHRKEDAIPHLGWLYKELRSRDHPQWTAVAQFMTVLGEVEEVFRALDKLYAQEIILEDAPVDTQGQEYRDWIEEKNARLAWERAVAVQEKRLLKKTSELTSVFG